MTIYTVCVLSILAVLTPAVRGCDEGYINITCQRAPDVSIIWSDQSGTFTEIRLHELHITREDKTLCIPNEAIHSMEPPLSCRYERDGREQEDNYNITSLVTSSTPVMNPLIATTDATVSVRCHYTTIITVMGAAILVLATLSIVVIVCIIVQQRKKTYAVTKDGTTGQTENI